MFRSSHVLSQFESYTEQEENIQDITHTVDTDKNLRIEINVNEYDPAFEKKVRRHFEQYNLTMDRKKVNRNSQLYYKVVISGLQVDV